MPSVLPETATQRFIRKALQIPFLLFLSLILVACASATIEVPTRSNTQTVPSLPPSLATQPAQIPEQRMLILEWPQTIRVGDSDLISLAFEVNPKGNITPMASIEGNQVQGETVFIANLYETHYVFAEGHLDISGLEIKPNSDILESLQMGKTVKFAWSVRPQQAGNYRGLVWLHLIFKPKSGGAEERRALSAQRIDIRAVNLLGLSGNAARWIGAIGFLLGSWLSFNPAAALFGKLWERIQKRRHTSKEG